MKKWINSLFIFNKAFELDSKENKDAVNIMLLTGLESLFFSKNTQRSAIVPKVKR